MKKILLTLVLSACTFCQGMQAQSITDITGKYIGDLYIAVGEDINDETEALPEQSVDLTVSETAGAIDFALYNFNFNGVPIGDIILPSIGVNFGTDIITFAENDKRELSFIDGGIQATASLNPNNSYVKGDSLIAFVDVMWTNYTPQMPINVLFKGKKLPAVDFTNYAGKYEGKLTIFNEDGTAEVESHENQPLTLSGKGSNDAMLTFGNPTLLGTEWNELAFIPSFINGTESLEILESQKIYYFSSTDGTKTLMAMTLHAGTSLTKDNLTFNFLVSDEQENIYSCTYMGTLTEPAGLHNATLQPDSDTNSIYTLNGVRLSKNSLPSLSKGVYIINGKKLIIK